MKRFKEKAEKICNSKGISDKRISQISSTTEAVKWTADTVSCWSEELGEEGRTGLAQAAKALAKRKEGTRNMVGLPEKEGLVVYANREENVVAEGVRVLEIDRTMKSIVIDSKVDLCAENKEIYVFGKSEIGYMLTSDISIEDEVKVENIRLSELKMKGFASVGRVKHSDIHISDSARIGQAKMCDITIEGNATIEGSEGCIMHIKGGYKIVVGRWSVATVRERVDAEIVVLKGGTLMVKKGISVRSIKMEEGAAIEVE